jgi:hypothetical protein
MSSSASSICRGIGPCAVEGHSPSAASQRSGRQCDRSESGTACGAAHTSRSTSADDERPRGGSKSCHVDIPEGVAEGSAELDSHDTRGMFILSLPSP